MYTYLFAKWESGCLIHQPILHGKTPPDGYVAKVTMNQPSQPMLVYDFKKEDFKTAVNEIHSTKRFYPDICHALLKNSFVFVFVFNTTMPSSIFVKWIRAMSLPVIFMR